MYIYMFVCVYSRTPMPSIGLLFGPARGLGVSWLLAWRPLAILCKPNLARFLKVFENSLSVQL